jgi:hypothetical protein
LGLGCLRSNVLGHGHVRQLRDAIEAQMKEERLVLCDVIFEPKKNSVIQHKLRQGKKKEQVSSGWCSPCIRCFGWLKILPGDLFVDLLCFLVGSCNGFSGHVQNTSSLKYIVSSNNTDLASVSNSADHTRICLRQGHHTYRGLQSGL